MFSPYECEAWSLTQREEREFKVSEKRVLRRNLGLQRISNSATDTYIWQASRLLMRDFRLAQRSNVNSVLLGYFVASSGNFVPTFRGHYPETSVRTYHYSLRNNPEEHSSQVFWCSTNIIRVAVKKGNDLGCYI